MFIYDVFKVVNSTAPMYGGYCKSKLVKVGTVCADNSNYAVCDVAYTLKLEDTDVELFAHMVGRA